MALELLAQAKKLHRAGDLRQAEQLYRQVLAGSPSHAEAQYLLAGTCHAQGRLAEAIALYREAVRLSPDTGEFHRNLAVALQQAGRRTEAFASVQAALRLNPQDVEAAFWLGNFHNEGGRYEDAMAVLRDATQLNPGYFKLHSELGVALEREGCVTEAIASFREALRHQPRDVIALGRLGAALSEIGLIAEAIAVYHDALSIRPGYPLALLNLAEMAREGMYSFSDVEVAELERRSHIADIPPMDRSLLCFAMGYVLESTGEYERAFSFFRQANDVRKCYFRERGLGFDAAAHAAWIERATAFFGEEYFRRVASYGIDSETPVFVVGMPRSGTTLVEQILASHPQIHGAGELMDIQRLSEQLPDELQTIAGYPECLAARDNGKVRALGERYLARLRSKGGDAVRVVDKLPDNYLHLGLIATLFPKARIILCRRDPLDTCVSCYTQSFHALRWTCDLMEIADYYQAHERLLAHWRAALPLPIFEVQYEELVQHQERVTRGLIAYCGVSWDERCLAFERKRRLVQSASRLQVQQPLHARSIGKWKRYERHLAGLVGALQSGVIRRRE